MEKQRFDLFTRTLGTLGTRRALLGVIGGAVMVGSAGAANAERRNHRRRRKQRGNGNRSAGGRVSAQAGPDCANPGPSKDLKGCGFQGDDLSGLDLSSSNLRGVNFRDAILRCADLSSSNLRQADFRNADLSGADLHSSACNGVLFNA
ncbi:MAG: pentapeptide repeat-containing protein, partial [Phyllobacterium sp.]